MAASQNPTQGSLFGENEHIDINEAKKLNSSKTSNGNLSNQQLEDCLLYTSPSPRDATLSRMPSSA